MNQTAGIERDPIWYEEIESIEKFREKESACIAQLFAEGKRKLFRRGFLLQ